MSDLETGLEFAAELLKRARSILAEHHDVVDGRGGQQLPNWAMRATNAIDEALGEASSYMSNARAVARYCAEQAKVSPQTIGPENSK